MSHHGNASRCFCIFLLVVADDSAHSLTEARYYVLGQTDSGRKLFLVFAIRKKKVRVITARDMSVKEWRTYDAQVKDTTGV